MQTIYLHVGFHKTATTFLQNCIYPNLKQVQYLSKNSIKKQMQRIRLKKLSDADIESIRKQLLEDTHGQPLLFSFEGLSGTPFSHKKAKGQKKILEDLRRLFPDPDFDVHIIVGIREQVELLTSLYVTHIHYGGIFNGPDFIDFCKKNGSLQNFCFHNYLKRVEKAFGKNHYVMVYEHFKKNSEEELLKLLNYMGVPEIPPYRDEWHWHNKSLGKVQVAIARKLNYLFKTGLHPKGPIPIFTVPVIGELRPRRLLQNKVSFALHYKKYEFPNELKGALKRTFYEDNLLLGEKYGLNLPETYFYPLRK